MYKIEKPPFYAAWATPILHDTLTGLRSNTNGEVIDIRGEVIAGLYCSGESQGGFAQHGLARCLVFGRVAGRNAAKARLEVEQIRTGHDQRRSAQPTHSTNVELSEPAPSELPVGSALAVKSASRVRPDATSRLPFKVTGPGGEVTTIEPRADHEPAPQAASREITLKLPCR